MGHLMVGGPGWQEVQPPPGPGGPASDQAQHHPMWERQMLRAS